jgi:uncharacterized protein (UPF0335 family)
MLMARANTNRPEKEYFDRAKALEDERAVLAGDLAEVYGEAKDEGHDVKILRLAVKRAREGDKKRRARLSAEAAAEDLLMALGEFAHTPLGEAALHAV